MSPSGGDGVPEQQDDWGDRERARRYASWSIISAKLVHRPFAKRIAAAVPRMEAAATIVDLGVGPGMLAVELGRLWPDAKIIGVDPSAEMLVIATENARKAGVKGFMAKEGTAEELPLASGTADLVVSKSSFHEWDDRRKALDEIRRVLKPGGTLILKDYDRAWLSPLKRKLLGFIHPLHMFKYSGDDVAGMVRDAGLGRVQVQRRGWSYWLQATKAA